MSWETAPPVIRPQGQLIATHQMTIRISVLVTDEACKLTALMASSQDCRLPRARRHGIKVMAHCLVGDKDPETVHNGSLPYHFYRCEVVDAVRTDDDSDLSGVGTTTVEG
jgi:hypothetical protein